MIFHCAIGVNGRGRSSTPTPRGRSGIRARPRRSAGEWPWRGRLPGSVTDFGIRVGIGPRGPCSRRNFPGTRSPWGFTSANGTPSTTFGPQSGRMSRPALGPVSEYVPLVVTTVAALRRSSGMYLPLALRKASRSVRATFETCFSKPSGMSDFFDAASPSISIGSQDVRPFPWRQAARIDVLGLGGEQSIEHAAVRGRGGVLHEVSLDVPARIEDVHQKLLAGMRGHAGEVRPDLAAGARVGVALGTLLLKDELSFGWLATVEHRRRQVVDHLLPIGVRQAATAGQELLGAVCDRGIRMSSERLLLVEREVVEPKFALFEIAPKNAGVQSARPSRAFSATARARKSHRRHCFDQHGCDPPSCPLATASSRPAASAGEILGVIRTSSDRAVSKSPRSSVS